MPLKTMQLDTTDADLLIWAGENLALAELVGLINEAVQWGPAPSLNGQLYSINQNATPSITWMALKELVDWGAGIIIDTAPQQEELLIADAALVEVIILAIKQLLDFLTGQGGTDTRVDITYIQKPLPDFKKRPRRDMEDDSLEFR
ncbi:TPA: hypothetical protein L3934_006132 [Pseudomonas aeruginosa]|uniref:hypothetical protein n=1 Tax=Pseudomonas aeruginosa TaxID=287 RepID=UPI00136E053F|nr:hypothetical protein [Pseudomonas aeruginosa]MXU52374.1 hypothetical protein [Pseudomonas aeruginosa]HBN9846900.1 hypothetical protein [Pseudomonas aeruginosa]HBN9848096.1 hypothetical protein [Pseudomonas aeruginosa]